ncbi:hypothetical protein RBB50_010361 [Rhinocladiella similis]
MSDETTKGAPSSSASPSASSYNSILSSLLPPTTTHIPLSLPVSPAKPHISSDAISSLRVHPVLEAGLHILNLDLPSAHFLLRHVQARPACEAMYLHGILHRVEGDIENARAWYGDVKNEEVFRFVWQEGDDDKDDDNDAVDRDHAVDRDGDGDGDGHETSKPESGCYEKRAREFLSRVESYKRCHPTTTTTTTTASASNAEKDVSTTSKDDNDNDTIAQTSLRELQRFMTFCERKFGTSPVSVSDASEIWVSMADTYKEKAANMITGGEGWREF